MFDFRWQMYLIIFRLIDIIPDYGFVLVKFFKFELGVKYNSNSAFEISIIIVIEMLPPFSL